MNVRNSRIQDAAMLPQKFEVAKAKSLKLELLKGRNLAVYSGQSLYGFHAVFIIFPTTMSNTQEDCHQQLDLADD